MTQPKVLKRILLTFVSVLFVAVITFVIWRNLPVDITRRDDIKFGNQLIAKLREYNKTHPLPLTNDWETLKRLGFKLKGDNLIPDYQKINDTTYELVYLEGFDGPYLLWNSNNKKWKEDFPSFQTDYHDEKDAVTMVHETEIYKRQEKLIDSLSSGKRHLNMTVTLEDTAKSIYLVKVNEDNGDVNVTYFNFLVDVKKRRILNPSGKVEGQ